MLVSDSWLTLFNISCNAQIRDVSWCFHKWGSTPIARWLTTHNPFYKWKPPMTNLWSYRKPMGNLHGKYPNKKHTVWMENGYLSKVNWQTLKRTDSKHNTSPSESNCAFLSFLAATTTLYRYNSIRQIFRLIYEIYSWYMNLSFSQSRRIITFPRSETLFGMLPWI